MASGRSIDVSPTYSREISESYNDKRTDGRIESLEMLVNSDRVSIDDTSGVFNEYSQVGHLSDQPTASHSNLTLTHL